MINISLVKISLLREQVLGLEKIKYQTFDVFYKQKQILKGKKIN